MSAPCRSARRGRSAWGRVAGVELRLQGGDPLGERVGPSAFGLRLRPLGLGSVALGLGSVALGLGSVALGLGSVALGLGLLSRGLFAGQPETLAGLVVREAQPRAVVGHHQPRAELVG
ncbi:MAG: hypothetical protein EPO40_07875, partial [Myxococcaceae bacterium]